MLCDRTGTRRRAVQTATRARNKAGWERKLVPPRLHLHVSREFTGRGRFRHLANKTVP